MKAEIFIFITTTTTTHITIIIITITQNTSSDSITQTILATQQNGTHHDDILTISIRES